MKKNAILVIVLILIIAVSFFATKNYKYGKNRVIDHVVINTNSTETQGKYLTDTNGKTLYVNSKNPTSETACDFSCLTYYKPFIVDIAYGKDQNFMSKKYNLGDKITIIKRADGLYQYAYDGKLLYRFTGDIKAGDINGLELFGKKDFEVVKL